MSVEVITGISWGALAVYSVLMFFLMRLTFHDRQTLNWQIFKRSLNKPRPGVMHYVEVVVVILTLAAILTTSISLIQMLLNNRSEVRETNRGKSW